MSGERSEREEDRSGAGTGRGRSVQPTPSGERPPVEPGEIQEIPLGMPVGPEEWRRLKERAERPERRRDAGADPDDAPEEG